MQRVRGMEGEREGLGEGTGAGGRRAGRRVSRARPGHHHRRPLARLGMRGRAGAAAVCVSASACVRQREEGGVGVGPRWLPPTHPTPPFLAREGRGLNGLCLEWLCAQRRPAGAAPKGATSTRPCSPI